MLRNLIIAMLERNSSLKFCSIMSNELPAIINLKPYPPSKIDFRYSRRDLSETFHECWAHKSKLPRFILPS